LFGKSAHETNKLPKNPLLARLASGIMLGNMPTPAMPLAVLTHEFFPYRGGIAVYVEETARAAAAAGYAVTVYAPDKPELRAKTWPFEVRPVAMRGSLGWGCRLALARQIRTHFDELEKSLVWLPEPGALLTAMYLNILGKLPAKKLVLTLHGSEILRFAGRPHRHWLFQKLLNRAERVGVVSEFNRELLHKHFRVAEEKIVVVSGALRSDFPNIMPQRQVKAPGAPVTLLTVGRVHPRKGQLCVLEALAKMNPHPKSALEYLIAGPVVNRAYQDELESLAQTCGVAVKFLGNVPDAELPALYARADIFIMTPVPHGPSIEGFGLVYLEAAAAGLPVIAHRTGGVAEAVRDGVTGLVVSPEDRAELGAAIRLLGDDPAKRIQLGEAGRARVRELSWTKNVEMLFGGCRDAVWRMNPRHHPEKLP
jgi:phosphatidylinositol alpha-1,6-mannosyltransferase